jgi:hypothetical protein
MSTPQPATDQQSAEQALQVTPASSKAGGIEVGNRGLQLSNLDEAWRFCQYMAASGMMPKGIDTAQKILFALELGFEVGLPPLAAVQSIAVINGRASLYGDVMLGLVLASGKFDEEAFQETVIDDEQGMPIKATCIVRRLPKGKPVTASFSMAEAKLAGLSTKDGPWKNYPRRMLQMRARGFALRDAFPDVLKGIISREEAQDLPPEKNITPTSTKPTTLDDLTERITGSTPAAAEATATQTQGTSAEPPSGETGAEAGEVSAQSDDGADDVLPGITGSLKEAKTVPDVTRIRNSFTGPASKLSDGEKAIVNGACDDRVAEIRAQRTKGKDQQASLV